jgi:hypothetical protein
MHPAPGECRDQSAQAVGVQRAIVSRSSAPDEDDPPRRVFAAGEQHQPAMGADERVHRFRRQLGVDRHVCQQHRLVVRRADELDADVTPHGAARTITARDVPRVHGLMGAIGVADDGHQTCRTSPAGQELGAPLDPERTVAQVVAQHGLRLGLAKDEEKRIWRVDQAGVMHGDGDRPAVEVQPC